MFLVVKSLSFFVTSFSHFSSFKRPDTRKGRHHDTDKIASGPLWSGRKYYQNLLKKKKMRKDLVKEEEIRERDPHETRTRITHEDYFFNQKHTEKWVNKKKKGWLRFLKTCFLRREKHGEKEDPLWCWTRGSAFWCRRETLSEKQKRQEISKEDTNNQSHWEGGIQRKRRVLKMQGKIHIKVEGMGSLIYESSIFLFFLWFPSFSSKVSLPSVTVGVHRVTLSLLINRVSLVTNIQD